MRERGLKLNYKAQQDTNKLSLPMRERGLKHIHQRRNAGSKTVAPHAGAWIETYDYVIRNGLSGSLPMRERGLKLAGREYIDDKGKSLPMRERGLKLPASSPCLSACMSLPMRERGLKLTQRIVAKRK